MMKLFKKEPYPSYPKEWDDPGNTTFRQFRLSGNDYSVLYRLVEKYMYTDGNEGIKRYRLLSILRHCEGRDNYLLHQRYQYPKTWKFRWWIKKACETFHRRFKTRRFRSAVLIERIAREVIEEI